MPVLHAPWLLAIAHSRDLLEVSPGCDWQVCDVQADDFVMCDDCKEKTKDKKALKLHRLPEVLLIMLKRTMYPSTEKDDRHITFPLEASIWLLYLHNLRAHCLFRLPLYWNLGVFYSSLRLVQRPRPAIYAPHLAN